MKYVVCPDSFHSAKDIIKAFNVNPKHCVVIKKDEQYPGDVYPKEWPRLFARRNNNYELDWRLRAEIEAANKEES